MILRAIVDILVRMALVKWRLPHLRWTTPPVALLFVKSFYPIVPYLLLSFLGCTRPKPEGTGWQERLLDKIPDGVQASGTTCSSDGKRAAYVAWEKDKWYAVVDGKRGPSFAFITDFQMSADWNRVAYCANRGGELRSGPARVTGGSWFTVVDGHEGEAFDGVGSLCLNPGGTHLAYAAKRENKWFAVLDGKPINPQDEVRDIALSADGRAIAYSAHESLPHDDQAKLYGNKWFVVARGKKGERFDYVADLILSPDGKTVAYAAATDVEADASGNIKHGRFFVVVGEEKGEEFDYVGRLSFSADGKIVAYIARKAGKAFIVSGKTRLRDEEWVGHWPVFSPDGKSVAYTAMKKGQWTVALDGRENGSFRGISSNPIFSPDGKVLTFIAEEGGKEFVVVGDKKGPEFDQAFMPVFSANGAQVGYGARLGSDLWWKVISLH